MPNRKPQVMWAAISPDKSSWCHLSYWRSVVLRELIQDPLCRPYQWTKLYRKGWRIVRVEVVETKNRLLFQDGFNAHQRAHTKSDFFSLGSRDHYEQGFKDGRKG